MCYWKNNWEPLDGRACHFRDSNGLECDTVLHRNNGTYGLIEVKIGGDTNIEEVLPICSRWLRRSTRTRCRNHLL